MSHSRYRLRSIALTPVAKVDEPSLKALEEELPEIFRGISRRRVRLSINIEEFTQRSSNQYHSTRILNALERHQQDVGADRLLAVTDLDLYIPNMNLVFGEVQLPGRAAVISTDRLKDMTDCGGEDLFLARIIKEAVHELGHTFGLAHCQCPTCVMFFSNSLKDTDCKGEQFCMKCLTKLGERT